MIDFLLGNDLLLALFAFIITLIPAIFVHEVGHFLAAKSVGITVLEFGIGFPPRFKRLFTKGETEFSLNFIPMGGFVRPLGEGLVGPQQAQETSYSDDPILSKYDENDVKELLGRGVDPKDFKAVNEANPLARIFFMAAGAFANFIFAFVLFMLAGLIGVPEPVGISLYVKDIADNSVWAGTEVQAGDIIEKVNGDYIPSYEAFLESMSSPEPVTFGLRNPDSWTTYDLTLDSTGAFANGVFVASVQSGSPAEDAGILPSDLILAINDLAFERQSDPVEDLIEFSNVNAGSEVTLSLLREGELLEVVLIPRAKLEGNQGRIGIGIVSFMSLAEGIVILDGGKITEPVPLSLPESIQFGINNIVETFSVIVSIPGQIMEGTISGEEARPVSVIGISQVGGELVEQSIRQNRPIVILNFIAMVNIFLGVTNLLPLPALDGGRILFVLIEVLRGKPISPEREGLVHYVGFALLLTLGVFIMLYDLINPLSLMK
ncbi:RIP metalloprotease RseP [Anaerolineales bacterium]